MKRLVDLLLALSILVIAAPIILLLSILVALQDRHSPFFVSTRVGKDHRDFRMCKLRTMFVSQEGAGAQSTANDDPRITRIGAFVRRYKFDEVPQLINVLRGDMSFVGPRPNVPSEVALYSEEERRLLDVRPGITDYSSIVFADLAEILEGAEQPDQAYRRLVRPWKSRLGLQYVVTQSLGVDVSLMWLTAVNVVDRPRALAGVTKLLERTGAPIELIRVARRTHPLEPTPPPGVSKQDWETFLG